MSSLALENRISKLEKMFVDEFLTPKDLKKDIASGLIRGLQDLKDNDERHLQLLEMARKNQKIPSPILNQKSATPDAFDTGGDLIPQNLTTEEQEILRMFYDKGSI